VRPAATKLVKIHALMHCQQIAMLEPRSNEHDEAPAIAETPAVHVIEMRSS
jgi:hypothetical protein